MERIFEVESKEIGIKCSAGTVRTYRRLFNRDLILDMANLEKELVETKTLAPESEEIAENISYTMAREYDSSLPPLEEWLQGFSPYFTYNIIAQCIYMWREGLVTINQSKKN